jgi:methionyl-tRNA formyltransferase
MEGAFTRAVLGRLLEGAVDLRALVLPGPAPGLRGALPVVLAGAPEGVADRAAARGVPVFAWPGRPPLPPDLRAPRPDLVLVACFPHRLPAELTGWARGGCLNLHPSLLPRYRGPAPLFWQLRAGETATGVTLHRVSARLDGGDLVARRRVPLPEGASGPEHEGLLGEEGAALFLEALTAAADGVLAARPQDEARASYQPAPGPADFEVPTTWSARRAYSFIRGTGDWGHPHTVVGPGGPWRVRAATGWWGTAHLGAPAERTDGRVRIQFSPGVLEVLSD